MVFELEDTSKVESLFSGWDAHDMNSVQLSKRFGYEFDHEYIAYEVCSDRRTH